MTPDAAETGFVAIGRNEGERFRRCLASLIAQSDRIVYVDSGSTDGSADHARSMGAETVDLPGDQPFTAARARNAGFKRLCEKWPSTDYVMFIDGDCELAPGFAAAGTNFLNSHPDAAFACGIVRERHPQASVYNRLCDIEWNQAPGEIEACGGIAMVRAAAFREAGGYDPSLAGGEEPELCVRLRERGWRVWRFDAPMAEHDASLTRFGQWWRRMKRGGRAFAEVSHRHRGSPKRIWARETIRAVAWASLAPAALLSGAIVHPVGYCLLAAYPLQIVRLAIVRRDALPPGAQERPWTYAVFMMIGKFAEAAGVIEFWLSGRAGRNPRKEASGFPDADSNDGAARSDI